MPKRRWGSQGNQMDTLCNTLIHLFIQKMCIGCYIRNWGNNGIKQIFMSLWSLHVSAFYIHTLNYATSILLEILPPVLSKTSTFTYIWHTPWLEETQEDAFYLKFQLGLCISNLYVLNADKVDSNWKLFVASMIRGLGILSIPSPMIRNPFTWW